MRKFKINKSIVRAASVLLSASMMLTPMAAYAEGEPTPIEVSEEKIDEAYDSIEDAELEGRFAYNSAEASINRKLYRAEDAVGEDGVKEGGLDDAVDDLADAYDEADDAISDYNDAEEIADQSYANAQGLVNAANTAAEAGKSSTETAASTTDEKADTNEAAAAKIYSSEAAAKKAEEKADELATAAEGEAANAAAAVLKLEADVSAAEAAVATAEADVSAAEEALVIANGKIDDANDALAGILADNGILEGDLIKDEDGKITGIKGYKGDSGKALQEILNALNKANGLLDTAVSDKENAEGRLLTAQGLLVIANKIKDINEIEAAEIEAFNLSQLNENAKESQLVYGYYVDDWGWPRFGLHYEDVDVYSEEEKAAIREAKNTLGEKDDALAEALLKYFLESNEKIDINAETFAVSRDEDGKWIVSYKDGDEDVTRKFEWVLDKENHKREGVENSTHWLVVNEITEKEVPNYTSVPIYRDWYTDEEVTNKTIYTDGWSLFYYIGYHKHYVYRDTKQVQNGTKTETESKEYYKEWTYYQSAKGVKTVEEIEQSVSDIDMDKLNEKVITAQTRVNNIQNAFDKTKAAIDSLKDIEGYEALKAEKARDLEILKSTLATAKLNLETAQTNAATAKGNAERARANTKGFKYNTPSVNPGSNPDQPSNDEEPVNDEQPANDVQPTNTVVVTTGNVTPAGTPIITTAPVQEVEITEEPAPLAETPAVTETVVEENKTPLAAPEVTVTEEPAPLAEAPVEKARISWLWLLVILALVAAAAEGFRRYMKKAKANK